MRVNFLFRGNMYRLLPFILCLVTTMIVAAPINLIWQHDRAEMWEEDWLMELLSGVELNVIDDGENTKSAWTAPSLFWLPIDSDSSSAAII